MNIYDYCLYTCTYICKIRDLNGGIVDNLINVWWCEAYAVVKYKEFCVGGLKQNSATAKHPTIQF